MKGSTPLKIPLSLFLCILPTATTCIALCSSSHHAIAQKRECLCCCYMRERGKRRMMMMMIMMHFSSSSSLSTLSLSLSIRLHIWKMCVRKRCELCKSQLGMGLCFFCIKSHAPRCNSIQNLLFPFQSSSSSS